MNAYFTISIILFYLCALHVQLNIPPIFEQKKEENSIYGNGAAWNYMCNKNNNKTKAKGAQASAEQPLKRYARREKWFDVLFFSVSDSVGKSTLRNKHDFIIIVICVCSFHQQSGCYENEKHLSPHFIVSTIQFFALADFGFFKKPIKKKTKTKNVLF